MPKSVCFWNVTFPDACQQELGPLPTQKIVNLILSNQLHKNVQIWKEESRGRIVFFLPPEFVELFECDYELTRVSAAPFFWFYF